MADSPTAPAGLRIGRLGERDLCVYKVLRDSMLAAHPTAFSSDASEASERTPESYRTRFGLESPQTGEFTLGAWNGAVLAGAIGCERDTRIKVRHIGHIAGMMVLDHFQGRGVGRALLAECVALARRTEGMTVLTLQVTADNLPAVTLYQRFGFVRYGTLPRAICIAGQYHAKDQMVLDL